MRSTMLCRIAIIAILMLSVLNKCLGQDSISIKAAELYDTRQFDEALEYTKNNKERTDLDKATLYSLRLYHNKALLKTGDLKGANFQINALYDDILQESSEDTLMLDVMMQIAYLKSVRELNVRDAKGGLEANIKGMEFSKMRVPVNLQLYGDLCQSRAALYRYMDSFDLARQYLDIAIDIAGDLPPEESKLRLASARNELAIVYAMSNQIRKAIKVFKEMLASADKEDNFRLQTRLHTNLGIAYGLMDDYGKSEYHYLKAHETNRKKAGKNAMDEYLIDVNLVRVYGFQYDFDKAEELILKNIERASEIWGEVTPNVANLYRDLGNNYIRKNEREAALVSYYKYEEIMKKSVGVGDVKYSDIFIDIGGNQIELGTVDEGLQNLQIAIEGREKLNPTYDAMLSDAYTYLANGYIKKEDMVNARIAIDKASTILTYNFDDYDYDFDKIDDPEEMLDPVFIRYEYLNKALDLGMSVENQIDKLDFTTDSLVTYIKGLYQDFGSRKQFVKKLKPLLSSRLSLYQSLYTHTNDEQFIAKAVAVLENNKNTFLYESIAEKEAGNSIPLEIYNKRQKYAQAVKKAKAELNYAKEDPTNPAIDSLQQLFIASKTDHYDLVEQIEKDYPEYYSNVYRFDAVEKDKLVQDLDHDEALIYLHESDEEYLALILSQDGSRFISLGERKMIDRICQKHLEANSVPNGSAQSFAINDSLFTLLIEPLDMQAVKIQLVADGLVGLIPIESIKNPKSGRYLIEDYIFINQYSGSIKYRNKTSNAISSDILAMAPVFDSRDSNIPDNEKIFYAGVVRDGDIVPLPGTLEEVDQLERLFDGQFLTREKASIANFLSLSQDKAIIHLATHGLINTLEPNLSSLVFHGHDTEDGPVKLEASEIAMLDLNADLVTLSACNTATGKIEEGEGVASLGRAFAYAGANNQVISLWSANDESTTKVMTSFYQNLKNGMPKAEALRDAKLAYIANSPKVFQAPFYWSAFTYYGENNPLQIKKGYSIAMLLGGGLILLLPLLIFFFRSKNN